MVVCRVVWWNVCSVVFKGVPHFLKGLLLQNGAKGVSEVQECVQNPGCFRV